MRKIATEKKKFFLKVLVNLLILAVMALGLMAILTWLQFLGDGEKLARFVDERPKIFYFTSAVIWVWLIFLSGIVRRINRAGGISFAIIIIVTYINKCKFRLRGTPLLPEDFQLAGETGSLADFIDFGELLRVILAIALVVILTIIFGKILEKAGLEIFPKISGNLEKREKRARATGRVATVLVSAVLLSTTTFFVRHHHGEKYEYVSFLDTTLTAWNQTRNYDENGFILGFLYNLAKLEIKAPEDYSEEKIAEIKAEFSKKQGSNGILSAEQSSADFLSEDVNFVIILNESFIDPETIKYYYDYDGGDVTPNLHKIEKKAMSGKMYSIDYGGGTANVEFETLTGLTNYWLNTVPYTNLLSKRGKLESIASELKEEGYATTAIHPYNGGMYKRNIVLKNEGFEKFITEAEMNFKERDGESEYINDRSSYQEILKELNETEEKALIFNITMQNHTPFKQENYPELEFRLKDGIVEDEGRRTAIEAYLETLHASDQYLGEFIEEIDNLNEKTVVLFYGDHSAGIFDELRDSEDIEDVKNTRYTPYFIYANFEVENENYVRGGNLPTVTPNCLVATMREMLGLKKNALNELVGEVCETTPILTATYYNYQEVKKTDLLRKYELVTYDLAAGKKYWEKD